MHVIAPFNHFENSYHYMFHVSVFNFSYIFFITWVKRLNKLKAKKNSRKFKNIVRSRGLRGGPKRCMVQLNMVTITEDQKNQTCTTLDRL